MAEKVAPKRLYQFVKVGAGDYLLPANDGKTLWRLKRVQQPHIAEDGINEYTIECWELYRWYLPLTERTLERVEIDDQHWDDWRFEESDETRAKLAIRACELIPK